MRPRFLFLLSVCVLSACTQAEQPPLISAIPTTAPSSSASQTPPSSSSAAPTSSSTPTTTTTTPKPEPEPEPAKPNASGRITFYGARDNDPPGSRQIAYPGVLHKQAGGTGTFADPLTFAAVEGKFRPGTKIYVPDVQRYFILEDTCATCRGSQIDLWVGAATDAGVLRCEESLTREGSRPYEVGPPSGRPVVPGDLYRGGRCFAP